MSKPADLSYLSQELRRQAERLDKSIREGDLDEALSKVLLVENYAKGLFNSLYNLKFNAAINKD